MGLMSYIHRQLLRKGRLSDLLPNDDDLASATGDLSEEREAVRAEIEERAAREREMEKEVAAAVRRLKELDRRNHYGELIRNAFGGKL
jgi:hypothetical protein